MSWGEGEAAHGNILKMNLLENRIVSTRETIDLSSVRVYPYLSLSLSRCFPLARTKCESFRLIINFIT